MKNLKDSRFQMKDGRFNWYDGGRNAELRAHQTNRIEY